jgi:hypothetical protein
LYRYNKAWYYQAASTCEPTCTGSQSPKADTDVDALAPPRVCDTDDTVCPTDYAAPTWEEFSLIVAARNTTGGRTNTTHDSCPVPDPCVVSPPPCFYVSTECVPTVVLDKTLDNSDTREWEDDNQNEDEKYLHEPILDITAITTWKLVSGRVSRDSPKEWNYRQGLVMVRTYPKCHAQMLVKVPKIPPKYPKSHAQMLVKVPELPPKWVPK